MFFGCKVSSVEKKKNANWRHDNVRNAIAEYLKVIGRKDIKIEPPLNIIEAEKFQKGNNADKARLDVAARGIWSTSEKTFVDVRILQIPDVGQVIRLA